MRRTLAILLTLCAAPLAAQLLDPPSAEPPPMPEGVEYEGVDEPEVTIIQRGEDEVREYRIAGRLYMVQVIPAHGVPYYLIDHDGNGELVRHDSRPDVSVPMWVIRSW